MAVIAELLQACSRPYQAPGVGDGLQAAYLPGVTKVHCCSIAAPVVPSGGMTVASGSINAIGAGAPVAKDRLDQ
jgi:hypothetical protein